ncbi:MAG TPA: ATP-binding protein, partial [Candidatus Binataceae bacterium]
NSLIRLISHLRDPDDLCAYIYLRRHCQEGMLARAEPSQFNTIHIALKQIVLDHIAATTSGERKEQLRAVVVAAIDERRLMVSHFYIESRERLLRASEEKYRNSIDHAPDPMYEIEPGTWMILGANSAADDLHQLMGGEEHTLLAGRPITDFVPPQMRGETQRHLLTVLRNGSDQSQDLPLHGRFFDVKSALIRYGNNKFIQMILHDVTHRREMLDGLLRAERLASAGTFAAGVAHEVNNPLASISSIVQALLPGESDPARRTSLSTILAQIMRISGTLKDLVNFAHPSAGLHQQIDINQLVSETLRVVTYDKRFRGLELVRELSPDLKAAYADNNEIQQVLLNLLFNAADATSGDGGVIKVITKNKHSERGADRVVIEVVDNGIGIPRENLERVFDPFFTTKPAGAGAGLGLSLCQRIVLANHGTIRIESELGKGTAVTIMLPMQEELAAAENFASAVK